MAKLHESMPKGRKWLKGSYRVVIVNENNSTLHGSFGITAERVTEITDRLMEMADSKAFNIAEAIEILSLEFGHNPNEFSVAVFAMSQNVLLSRLEKVFHPQDFKELMEEIGYHKTDYRSK